MSRKKPDYRRAIVLREWESWAALRKLNGRANGTETLIFYNHLTANRPEIAVLHSDVVRSWLIQGGKAC